MKQLMVPSIKALMILFVVMNLSALVILPHYALAEDQAQPAQQANQPADQQNQQVQSAGLSGQTAIAVAIVVGLGCLGAGVAVSRVASAAIGAVSERPEMFGRSLVFVGLAEGIAIYGLIIGIMLMQA